jgi:hypothetical protein
MNKYEETVGLVCSHAEKCNTVADRSPSRPHSVGTRYDSRGV